MPSPILKELLQHATALRALARDLVGDAYADDLVQDTAIQAMTAPPRRPGLAGGWLATVVRHLASKHRRAERVRAVHERGAARSEAQPAERSAEDADTLRKLTEVVAALPEPYRGTLLARYLRDRSPQQIAAETDTPVRTVKTRLQRGLRLLRERLEERDAEWRPLLVAAFGLERATATLTPATLTLLMSTTTKIALACAAVLLTGTLIWHFATQETPPKTEQAVASAPASTPVQSRPVADNDRTVVDPALGPGARSTPQPAPASSEPAPVDAIVVRAVDAGTGAPIERFALRAVVAPDHNMMAPQNPLLHGGTHPDGRLELPASAFEQRVFELEDSDHRYLPSRWFSLADATLRDGRRMIEVRMPAPVEVELTVVHEHGRAPAAGTKVELVRPWTGSSEITVRTNVQPAERFFAPPGEPEQILRMFGGRAMLLAGGTTDEAGRVRLMAPPNEPLALRLLGPGHRPTVRNNWVVEPGASPVKIVEAVMTGAAIRGRVLPMEALRRLRVELPEPGPGVAPQMLARYATGLKLRHKGTGETIPPGQFLSPPTPLAEDGTFTIDGLHAGDWQVFFAYPLRVQDLELDRRLAGMPMSALLGLESMEVELPAIEGVAGHELRVIDVDVSTFLPGKLDAALTRDGRRPGGGAMLLQPIAGLGAPLPILRGSPNLRLDKTGRIVATLPPARYSARWFPDGGGSHFPLADFGIRSGVTTSIDFVIDTVPAQFRVVEADGVTPASGLLQFSRDARTGSPSSENVTDAGGLAAFSELPRGVLLRATFRRPLPPDARPDRTGYRNTALALGQFGEAIDLGTLTATGEQTQPQVLRLPAR